MMSKYDRKNVGSLLSGEGDWFTAHLFRLIAKADNSNRARLHIAFPDEVDLVSNYLGRHRGTPTVGPPYTYPFSETRDRN